MSVTRASFASSGWPRLTLEHTPKGSRAGGRGTPFYPDKPFKKLPKVS